jgi:hypothetical protein
MPRRGNRTQPGVLTPGLGIIKSRALPVRRSLGDYGTKEEKWHQTGVI